MCAREETAATRPSRLQASGPEALGVTALGVTLPSASLCACNASRGAARLPADTALPVHVTLSLGYLVLRDKPP